MGLPVEAIERAAAIEAALNYIPRNGSTFGTVDLGIVDGKDIRLVRRVLSCHQRAVDLPGQPLIDSREVKPVWALVRDADGEKKKEVTTLPYVVDVLGLGEDLATRVVDRINAERLIESI